MSVANTRVSNRKSFLATEHIRFGLVATAILLLAVGSASASPFHDKRSYGPEGTSGRFTYWQYPSELAVPCDITAGPDGALYTQGLLSNSFARLDPETLQVTDEFDIPFTTEPLGNTTLPNVPGIAKPFFACALVTGFDGYIYASNGLRNQLVGLDVRMKEVVVFEVPNILGNAQPLNDVTAAPDGIYMTQTTGNSITRFDYKTHKFTQTQLSTPLAAPLGIYYASDGRIWFLETAAQKYGRLDRVTKKIKEYPLPLSLLGPLTMRAETRRAQNGSRYIWFTAAAGSIGRIDITDASVKALPVGLTSIPIELCPASGDASTLPKNWAPGESNIWFTHEATATLGKLKSASGDEVEIPFPDNLIPGSPVNPQGVFGTGMWCNPRKYVWFTQASTNRILRYRR